MDLAPSKKLWWELQGGWKNIYHVVGQFQSLRAKKRATLQDQRPPNKKLASLQLFSIIAKAIGALTALHLRRHGLIAHLV